MRLILYSIIGVLLIAHAYRAQGIKPVPWKTFKDGSCYLAVNEKRSWNDAKKYCEERSARLITLPVIEKDAKKVSEVFYNGGNTRML